MKKKILSLGLAVAMAVSMTACGSSSGTESKADPTTAPGSESASEAGKPEEGGAATDGVFKIGGIGPITGETAIYGKAVMNAANLAVDEINAAGGVNGAKLEMNFQDDENDAEKSINAYNTLKDWGMQMLMGTVTSTPCVAVADKTNTDNIFQLTPSGSSVQCVQYPNAFRVCFSDPNQGAASAKYIGDNKLATKVAVIYDSSSVYSQGIYERFQANAADNGIEVVSAEAFTADSNKDFKVQLQKAKDAGAELVFLPIYYAEASLILAQANSMGYSPEFFGCDGLDGLLDVQNFDKSLAENVMLLTPFAADAKDEATQNFVSSYVEKFGETPNQFAADSYDAIYAIKAALEDSKATPDMSASDLCEALKTSMVKISINGVTGENMTWTEGGEPNKAPKAVKIVDGKYTAM